MGGRRSRNKESFGKWRQMEETGLSIGSAPQTRTGEQRKIKENEGKMAHSSGHLSFEEAAERAKKREREKNWKLPTRAWQKWNERLAQVAAATR